jgi:thymidylate synthase (FAD)
MQKVKLIGYTGTAIPECTNLKELVAYMARVSNPSNQANHQTSDKLLEYLKKHSHWSPFEMVNIVMEIKTTRDIAHQIVRHRSFAFQEFSQRYAEVEPQLQYREARLQDTKNRQNSIETDDQEIADNFEWCQQRIWANAWNMYKKSLEAGVAKEQARTLLPEGLTPTTLYMNGTLRSWIHYCDLRMGNGTQKEHQEIAEQAWLIIEDLMND